MERRQFLLVCACAAGAAFFSRTPVLRAAEPINYDRLMTTLRPKTEGEKKYLKEIVLLVCDNQIPEKLVYAAWRVAETKQKSKRVRYFAEVLTILCKRNGINLSVKLVP